MGLFNALFGKKKTSLQDLDKKNDDFIAKNPIAENDENEMMRNASKLMTSGKFSESLDLYKKLSENYPNNKDLYESQIGVAYYFLGDYENAVTYYTSSLNNGGDKSMMDDNIWEAAEAFSKLEFQEKESSTTNTTKLIEKYLEIFPNGRYAKKAKKHLGK
ncbi:tetratricopeptide repeat protein [Flavobacterium sp. HNIBRBA15423]|uniref:tetratricopeptide repeat protein n=1 Tax=Flavobacterium sp. HNIBRBA15423 TaxID=3458683 RepID=UPI0040449867